MRRETQFALFLCCAQKFSEIRCLQRQKLDRSAGQTRSNNNDDDGDGVLSERRFANDDDDDEDELFYAGIRRTNTSPTLADAGFALDVNRSLVALLCFAFAFAFAFAFF